MYQSMYYDNLINRMQLHAINMQIDDQHTTP